MVFAAIGYWAIGFAGGWALTFPLGLGPVGMWWGFVIGLAVVAVLLTARLWRQSHLGSSDEAAAARKPS